MRPITEVLVAVQKSDRVLNRMMTETARNQGVTKPEMDVLLFLYNNPQYDKAADVSELRFLAKSYVSKAVDLLQKRGYLQVQNDEKDRRVMRLKLTPAADPLSAAGNETRERFLKILFEGVSQEELQTMQKIHQKMMENLERNLQ